MALAVRCLFGNILLSKKALNSTRGFGLVKEIYNEHNLLLEDFLLKLCSNQGPISILSQCHNFDLLKNIYRIQYFTELVKRCDYSFNLKEQRCYFSKVLTEIFLLLDDSNEKKTVAKRVNVSLSRIIELCSKKWRRSCVKFTLCKTLDLFLKENKTWVETCFSEIAELKMTLVYENTCYVFDKSFFDEFANLRSKDWNIDQIKAALEHINSTPQDDSEIWTIIDTVQTVLCKVDLISKDWLKSKITNFMDMDAIIRLMIANIATIGNIFHNQKIFLIVRGSTS